MAILASDLLRNARKTAGLNQRELASRAQTAQSVVARIELGLTSPSWDTLGRLLDAAGFTLETRLAVVAPDVGAMLVDRDRILELSPADRLRELRNVDRFLSAMRRM